MEQTPEKLIILAKHKSPVVGFGAIEENNDPNHYYSISDDGNLKEINFTDSAVMVDIKLPRPNDDFLKHNNHVIKVKRIGEEYKITKFLYINSLNNLKIFSDNKDLFDEKENKKIKSYFALGYEDGLICIWSIFNDQISNYKEDEDKDGNSSPKTIQTRTRSNVDALNMKSKKEKSRSKGVDLKNDESSYSIKNDTKSKDSSDSERNIDEDLNSKKIKKIEIDNTINTAMSENKNKNALDINSKEKDKDKLLSGYSTTSNKYKLFLIKSNFATVNTDYIKDYVNIYKLELVLVGQVGRILSLEYIPDKKYLVSTSEQKIIKIWDLYLGVPLYTFNLDINTNRMLYLINPKNNIGILNIFSSEPFLLQLNMSKDPIAINTTQTPYNDLNEPLFASVNVEYIPEDPKAKKKKSDVGKTPKESTKAGKNIKGAKPQIINRKYFIFGTNKGFISVFDQNLNYIKDIRVNGVEYIISIFQYKEFFIIVSQQYAYFVSIDFEKGEITKKFNIVVCEDMPNKCYLEKERFLVVCSEDRFVYKLDLEREAKVYERRQIMLQEDKDSEIMNIQYLKSLNKKKKRVASSKKTKSGKNDKEDKTKSKSVPKPKGKK